MAKSKKTQTGAGSRRAHHFASGGTLHEWRGGLSTKVPSGKVYKRKSKHKKEEG